MHTPGLCLARREARQSQCLHQYALYLHLCMMDIVSVTNHKYVGNDKHGLLMHAVKCCWMKSPTCIEDVGIVVPRARPVALMYKNTDQLVGDALPPIWEGRGGGQVRAVRAQKGCQVEAGLKGHMACKLDKVWSEAFEVEGEGVGGCVDVQRLVGCLIPANHNVNFDLDMLKQMNGVLQRLVGYLIPANHNFNFDLDMLKQMNGVMQRLVGCGVPARTMLSRKIGLCRDCGLICATHGVILDLPEHGGRDC